jgi:VIT1/CCC1 family predicted Fe2+/Mn2+ transporter
MSMAAGEYVSVHSQADTECADRAREANRWTGAWRVTAWGAGAMALTVAVGSAFGVA